MNIRQIQFGDFYMVAKPPTDGTMFEKGILETRKLRGLLKAEQDMEVEDETEGHGVRVSSHFYRGRNFVIYFRLLSSAQNTFMQLARSVARHTNIVENPTQDIIFTTTETSAHFPAGVEFISTVHSQGLSPTGSTFGQTHQEFMLQLISTDHRIYENREILQTINLEDDAGGAVLDFVLPVDLAPSEAGIIEFNVLGDYDTHPIARISGPLDTPTLFNEATGVSFTYNGQINAGQYIEVDFNKKTVVNQNGVDVSSRVSAASLGLNQWVLKPGLNPVSLTHLGESNAQANVQLRYRHAYSTTSVS